MKRNRNDASWIIQAYPEGEQVFAELSNRGLIKGREWIPALSELDRATLISEMRKKLQAQSLQSLTSRPTPPIQYLPPSRDYLRLQHAMEEAIKAVERIKTPQVTISRNGVMLPVAATKNAQIIHVDFKSRQRLSA